MLDLTGSLAVKLPDVVTPGGPPGPPRSTRSDSAPRKLTFFPACSGAGKAGSVTTARGLISPVLSSPRHMFHQLSIHGGFAQLEKPITNESFLARLFAHALLFYFLEEKAKAVILFSEAQYVLDSDHTELVLCSSINIEEMVQCILAIQRFLAKHKFSTLPIPDREAVKLASKSILIDEREVNYPSVIFHNSVLIFPKFLDALYAGLDAIKLHHPELYERFQIELGSRLVETKLIVMKIEEQKRKILNKFSGIQVLHLGALFDASLSAKPLDLLLAGHLLVKLQDFIATLIAYRFNLAEKESYFVAALTTDIRAALESYARIGPVSDRVFFEEIELALNEVSQELSLQFNPVSSVEEKVVVTSGLTPKKPSAGSGRSFSARRLSA